MAKPDAQPRDRRRARRADRRRASCGPIVGARFPLERARRGAAADRRARRDRQGRARARRLKPGASARGGACSAAASRWSSRPSAAGRRPRRAGSPARPVRMRRGDVMHEHAARRPTSRCWRSAARRRARATGAGRRRPAGRSGGRGRRRPSRRRPRAGARRARARGCWRGASAPRAPAAASGASRRPSRRRGTLGIVGGAQQLGRVVGELGQRARQPAGQQRLQARRRRPARALVVGRRGAVARQAAEQAAGDPVGGLGQQVAVEVVPVRRPDAIGEPDSRGSGPAPVRAPARR